MFDTRIYVKFFSCFVKRLKVKVPETRFKRPTAPQEVEAASLCRARK